MPERKLRPKADGVSGRGKRTAPAELANGKKKSIVGGENGKKKKKNVKEIDGVLWLLDDSGKPVKKVRKKGEGEEGGGAKKAGSKPAGSKSTGKPKKNIAEIDGQLYLLDANGKPSKKIRKKGERGTLKRSPSTGKLDEERGRSLRQINDDRQRSKSMGAVGRERNLRPLGPAKGPKKVVPKDYVDAKGRRHIIDEDGNKTVIDKNGKKLRPKKKPGEATKSPKQGAKRSLTIPEDSSLIGGGGGLVGGDFGLSEGRDNNLFDNLWDDGASVQAGANSAGGAKSKGGGDNDKKESSQSLSAKISEYGKENRELSLKLLSAEEQIQDLTEQNKKEKAKNVKATTDMMQLKADSTEAKSQLQKYKAEIKDCYATLEAKDKQLRMMKEKVAESDKAVAEALKEAQNAPKRQHPRPSGGDGADDNVARCPECGTVNEEVEELFNEKRALQRKLEFERTSTQSDAKKKDDKIAFMAKEIASLREEMEMMIKGERGDIKANPTFVRLMNDKKRVATELEQERNLTNIRFKGMKETIEGLERENLELQRKLASRGGGGDEVDFATGLPRNQVVEKRRSVSENYRSPLDGGGSGNRSQKELSKHIGEIQIGMGGNDKHDDEKKGWWEFGK